MTAWPATLPQSLSVDGFQKALPDIVIATQMDVGPPKRRRRTVANVSKLSGSIMMTDAQWDILEDFYVNIVKGALPFDFPEPRESGSTISVCFAAPPSCVPWTPGKWKVSLSLEVQP